jgi:hypothetical protein
MPLNILAVLFAFRKPLDIIFQRLLAKSQRGTIDTCHVTLNYTASTWVLSATLSLVSRLSKKEEAVWDLLWLSLPCIHRTRSW